MRVSKWGNTLAIHLPASVVRALALKEGDEVEIHVVGDRAFGIDRDRSRERALASIRASRKRFLRTGSSTARMRTPGEPMPCLVRGGFGPRTLA
jgi:antitoxin MazE